MSKSWLFWLSVLKEVEGKVALTTNPILESSLEHFKVSVDLLVLLYDVLIVKVYDIELSLNLGFSPMLKVGCVLLHVFKDLGI